MHDCVRVFEHDWESHLLLREADAKGAAAVPVAAPADCLDAVPDAPAVREEDEQLLLPGTTWPFTGPRGSVLAHEVQRLARELAMESYGRRFQTHHSDAYEYNPYWNHGIQDGTWFHRSPLQQLFEGPCRAVYGDAPIPTPFDDDRAGWHDDDDNRPPEVDAVDLPPPLVGATRTGRARVPRGSAFAGPSHPIASRPVAVSDRVSPGAPLRRRPPKLSSRDKRALQERPPAVGPGLLRSTLARGGPGAGAGTSSVASDDSSDDDGWRREPGADEVCENYMDSKFGGEGADMSESVMG